MHASFALLVSRLAVLVILYCSPKFIRGFPQLRAFKEARKGFLGCYSVCETMKDTKEG